MLKRHEDSQGWRDIEEQPVSLRWHDEIFNSSNIHRCSPILSAVGSNAQERSPNAPPAASSRRAQLHQPPLSVFSLLKHWHVITVLLPETVIFISMAWWIRSITSNLTALLDIWLKVKLALSDSNYPLVKRKERGAERGNGGVSKDQSEKAGSVSMDTWRLSCPSMVLGVTVGSGWFGRSLKPAKWNPACSDF